MLPGTRGSRPRRRGRTVIRRFTPAFAVLLAVTLGACSEVTEPDTHIPTETAIITPAGGTVVANGGALRLEVPAGALEQAVEITITAAATSGDLGLVPGTVYQLGPDGLLFNPPARLTLTYDEANLPEGADETVLALLTERPSGHWHRADDIAVDASANTVAGSIATFSRKGISAIMAVAPSVEFVSVGAGEGHTCALSAAGQAYCWGLNDVGQLGTTGGGFSRSTPEPVDGSLTFVFLSVGRFHTCGLTAEGEAHCWGRNDRAQLGTETATPVCNIFPCSRTPVPVSGGISFAQISAGAAHTCGVDTGGIAYCWGRNEASQLGIDPPPGEVEQCGEAPSETPCTTTPVPVETDLTFTAVSAGVFVTCGLTPAGAVYCWGRNEYGQFGTGMSDQPATATPTQGAGNMTFTSIDVGIFNTCGLGPDGAFCWGRNTFGQLGNASTTDAADPAPVMTGVELTFIDTSQEHTCGILDDGDAACWGLNSIGQLGAPSPRTCPDEAFLTESPCSTVPLVVSGGLQFATVSAGRHHTCALAINGAVFCWGSNDHGELGSGPPPFSSEMPRQVEFPE